MIRSHSDIFDLNSDSDNYSEKRPEDHQTRLLQMYVVRAKSIYLQLVVWLMLKGDTLCCFMYSAKDKLATRKSRGLIAKYTNEDYTWCIFLSSKPHPSSWYIQICCTTMNNALVNKSQSLQLGVWLFVLPQGRASGFGLVRHLSIHIQRNHKLCSYIKFKCLITVLLLL